MFIATGYNTWGLTNGFLAGKIISDIILKKDNEYIKLFNPKRSNLISLNDTLKNIEGYINGFTKGTKYTCPHLGCKLIYNELEQTYDCPCHGSRFDSSGNCISSPANKNIKID